MEFGLNLFSIRNEVDTHEKFLGTAKKLKDMGYDSLQCSACPYDVELYKKVTAITGMPIVLTHVGYDRITEDTEALMAEHEAFGCRNIGLGYMNCDDDALVRAQTEKLNVAAERMQKNGFNFFYHNHNGEFRKMADGRTVMDYFIEEAKAFNFTFDTYWAYFAGASLTEYITKLNGRIECVHLKDSRFDGNAKIIAPVGTGSIDFKDIIPKMINAGTKHFLVEQDNAADMPDTLGQVKISIDYLKNNF